jgi:hypothetical protein
MTPVSFAAPAHAECAFFGQILARTQKVPRKVKSRTLDQRSLKPQIDNIC